MSIIPTREDLINDLNTLYDMAITKGNATLAVRIIALQAKLAGLFNKPKKQTILLNDMAVPELSDLIGQIK